MPSPEYAELERAKAAARAEYNHLGRPIPDSLRTSDEAIGNAAGAMLNAQMGFWRGLTRPGESAVLDRVEQWRRQRDADDRRVAAMRRAIGWPW